MKNAIRGILKTLAPGLLGKIQKKRKEQYEAHLRQLSDGVLKVLVANQGFVIRGGPFDGMPYISEFKNSSLIPKLIGIYERELFKWIGEILKKDYDAIVDVGCAEGYYAVGLARAMPNTTVYAYDIDVEAQKLCKQLADLNKVADRVIVRGECTHAELAGVLAKHHRVLIFSDCEGFESVLLDPAKVPGIDHADLLVELHDFVVPGVTELMEDRFLKSHLFARTPAIPANPSDYPVLAGFDAESRANAVDEHRPPGMEWLLANAKFKKQ